MEFGYPSPNGSFQLHYSQLDILTCPYDNEPSIQRLTRVPHEATNVDRKLQDLKQFAKKILAKKHGVRRSECQHTTWLWMGFCYSPCLVNEITPLIFPIWMKNTEVLVPASIPSSPSSTPLMLSRVRLRMFTESTKSGDDEWLPQKLWACPCKNKW